MKFACPDEISISMQVSYLQDSKLCKNVFFTQGQRKTEIKKDDE